MKDYVAAVILLNILVDLMLLLTVNRMAGFPQKVGRCLLGAVIGGFYSGICMMPGLHWAGHFLCRFAALMAVGAAAYGTDRNGIRRCMLFLLLSMALGGVVLGMGDGGVLSVIGGGLLFWLVGWSGIGMAASTCEYVEVELVKGNQHEKLLALLDTGNCLRDPVSGQRVLVVDAQCGKTLLGLTKEQLRAPVETLASGRIPGLRLIPYRAVGQSVGMLLAMRMDNVKIGNKWVSTVVAFAPEGLGEGNTYRALMGGTV